MPHQIFRATYLGVLILLVMFALLASGGTQPLSLGELAQAGAQVFRLIAYTQVILVCLLAPLFMASALGSEQQGETYEILLTTPLSSLQIVLGSLFGRLFFVWALLASGLPLFSVLLLFGGVPITSVFVAFAIAGLTALFVGSVAVTISVCRAGGRRTVFAFVIGIAGYLLSIYLLDMGLLRRMANPAGTTTVLTPLHPLLVLESAVKPAGYRPPTAIELAHQPKWIAFYLGRPFATFALLTAVGSSVMMLFCGLVLRPMAQGEGLLPRLLRFRGGSAQREGRTVWNHAIAWREAQARGGSRASVLARVAYLILSVVLTGVWLMLYHRGMMPEIPNRGPAPGPGPGTSSGLGPGPALQGSSGMMPAHEVFRGGLTVLLMLQTALLALVAVYISAGSISQEREDGTLDLILTTPVTPRRYVWGKLRGLVRFLAILIAAPVLCLAMVAIYTLLGNANDWSGATYSHPLVGGGSVDAPLLLPEAPILAMAMLAPMVATCVAWGMDRSLGSRSVIGAAAWTVTVIAGFALVMGFCGLTSARNLPLVGPMINAMSPATSLLMVLDPYRSVADFEENPVLGRIWIVMGAALGVAIYVGVVMGVVRGMVSNFDSRVRRLSGTT